MRVIPAILIVCSLCILVTIAQRGDGRRGGGGGRRGGGGGGRGRRGGPDDFGGRNDFGGGRRGGGGGGRRGGGGGRGGDGFDGGRRGGGGGGRRGDGGGRGGGRGGGGGGRGDGLNREERRVVNFLFRTRRQQDRIVAALPDGTGYRAETFSNNPDVVDALHVHSEQMARLIERGRRTRQFDPAMVHFHDVQNDVLTETDFLPDGVSVTVRGRTPEAAAAVCNHANGVGLFLRNGRREEDRRHPRVQPPYQCVIN